MEEINDVLLREEEKYLNKKNELIDAIARLPKGSLFIRSRNGRRYCYLIYREQGKIVSKYAGTAVKETELRTRIQERKTLEAQLKEVDNDLKRIQKMKQIK